MIRSTGVFLDTRQLTARFVVTYEKRMLNGLLKLRDLDEEGEPYDLPILAEWNSARAFLSRFKSAAAQFLGGQKAVLGKAWLESLPGMHGTPWTLEEDDYAQSVVRTRTALISVPEGWSHSGLDKILMMPGVVNVIEHRTLHSEQNLSSYSRLHLIVDVQRPTLPEET